MCDFAVVDDADLIATVQFNDTTISLQKAQQMIFNMNDVASKLNKSYCWAIEFEWHKCCYWVHKNLVNREGLALYARHKDSKVIKLQIVLLTYSQEMLGVKVSLDEYY